MARRRGRALVCGGTVALTLTIALAAVLPGRAQERSRARRPSRDVGRAIEAETGDPRSCDRIRFGDDERAVARDEEQLTVSAVKGAPLAATLRNGGIRVFGADRSDYAVKACKVAIAPTQADAQALVGRIGVALNGSEVVIDAPPAAAGARTMVYLVVESPRDGELVLSTVNGPLAIEDFRGNARLRTENGPIAVRRSQATIDAQARNGPVTVSGSGGAVSVVTQNGPIDVQLDGPTWEGRGIDARATNGPLSLRLPDGFQSGVRLELSRHTPFSCRSAICDGSGKHWDEDGRVWTLGAGEPTVRLSTVNGPVTIAASRDRSR